MWVTTIQVVEKWTDFIPWFSQPQNRRKNSLKWSFNWLHMSSGMRKSKQNSLQRNKFVLRITQEIVDVITMFLDWNNAVGCIFVWLFLLCFFFIEKLQKLQSRRGNNNHIVYCCLHFLAGFRACMRHSTKHVGNLCKCTNDNKS